MAVTFAVTTGVPHLIASKIGQPKSLVERREHQRLGASIKPEGNFYFWNHTSKNTPVGLYGMFTCNR